jgi:hypothetical protein
MATRARASKPKTAEQGERMIEVKVRFWTNDIGGKRGVVLPKHAWAGGVVRVERNATHGIQPGPPRPFHSLMDLQSVIERVLIEHGIVLHLNRRMKKYFAEEHD